MNSYIFLKTLLFINMSFSPFFYIRPDPYEVNRTYYKIKFAETLPVLIRINNCQEL